MEKKNDSLSVLSEIQLAPVPFEDAEPDENYFKLPLSRISALGTSFEPLAAAIQKVFGGAEGTSGIYKVTVPKGMHLATFKNGAGNLGSALNANNQVAGQAILNPLVCNPTMIFMAAALVNVDKKLDAIQELQREMLDYIAQKERSELRGNIVFLSDVYNDFKYNWDNDMFKTGSHIKVLDIRQNSEQKLLFYREQITSKLNKRTLLHGDKEAKKQIDTVQSLFKEYQLSLYLYAFSSFLDVMLAGNYNEDYLNGVSKRIEDHASKYDGLYSQCFDRLESYYGSSVQSALLKGLKKASKATGEAIAKVPVISKGQLDEALIEAGDKLDSIGSKRVSTQMKKFSGREKDCVGPFVENIRALNKLYNNSTIEMLFDEQNVYISSQK
ncbi:MAG: hypothetical protein IKH31_06110 [Clostridia bacterium]|nr:hypothetical protein [Clostridia bacterium]